MAVDRERWPSHLKGICPSRQSERTMWLFVRLDKSQNRPLTRQLRLPQPSRPTTNIPREYVLLFDQIGVAGDALLLIVLVDPGVTKAAVVIERLPLVGALAVVGPDHDGRAL